MCLIDLATGLRFSKVLGLSWEDINFNQKTLRVNRSFDHSYSRKFKDTNSDSSKRTIVIDEPTINLLKEYKQANRSRHPNYIFLDTNLDNVTNNAVNKVLRRACARANIQEISFHFLRHTHCSILLFQGISIHYISKRLGYSRVSITLDHYSHILDEMGQVKSKKASEIIGEMNEYTMQN